MWSFCCGVPSLPASMQNTTLSLLCDPASFLVSTGMLAFVMVSVATQLMFMMVIFLEDFESWTGYHVVAACSEKVAEASRGGHEWEEGVHGE